MFIFFPFQVSTSARPRLVIPPSTRPRLSSFPGVVVNPPDHETPIPNRDASVFPGVFVNPPDHEVPHHKVPPSFPGVFVNPPDHEVPHHEVPPPLQVI